MAKSNLLNTRTVNYLELIGNGRTYRVPPYQRDYSWTEEQWDDLWDDLLELRSNADRQHYLGALVVEAESDRRFLVIDGQQRLATLSLLSLAVIGRLDAMAARGVDAGRNEERGRELRNRFIGEKDPASLIEFSRLQLNETDNAFYQDYLVQRRAPRNPRRLPGSNRLLLECFRYFSGRLGSLDDLLDNGRELASVLSETVARQLLFTLITVDDEMNAYTIFETLNARGLELTTTDLIKNYLFSQVRVNADLQALQRRWRALVETVDRARFPEFLRFHMRCEQHGIRGRRLFRRLRDRARTGQDVFNLVDELEDRSELFAAILDPAHEYWMDLPEARPYVRELGLFRARQPIPLLFAAWDAFSRENFVRVLKLASGVSFRYAVVSGLNPNALEAVYHRAARAVLDGRASTPAEVFERLRPIYVDDEKMRQDFALLTIDTRGRGKKLAKYVLARLEQDLSGRDCNPDTDPGTIEHVLPENPVDTWRESYPEARWENDAYRLGNLTLLEAPLNRAVGNSHYSDKHAAYSRSGYRLTRRIAEMAAEEWTLELLHERQRRLAARAAHVWRADFA